MLSIGKVTEYKFSPEDVQMLINNLKVVYQAQPESLGTEQELKYLSKLENQFSNARIEQIIFCSLYTENLTEPSLLQAAARFLGTSTKKLKSPKNQHILTKGYGSIKKIQCSNECLFPSPHIAITPSPSIRIIFIDPASEETLHDLQEIADKAVPVFKTYVFFAGSSIDEKEISAISSKFSWVEEWINLDESNDEYTIQHWLKNNPLIQQNSSFYLAYSFLSAIKALSQLANENTTELENRFSVETQSLAFATEKNKQQMAYLKKQKDEVIIKLSKLFKEQQEQAVTPLETLNSSGFEFASKVASGEALKIVKQKVGNKTVLSPNEHVIRGLQDELDNYLYDKVTQVIKLDQAFRKRVSDNLPESFMSLPIDHANRNDIIGITNSKHDLTEDEYTSEVMTKGLRQVIYSAMSPFFIFGMLSSVAGSILSYTNSKNQGGLFGTDSIIGTIFAPSNTTYWGIAAASLILVNVAFVINNNRKEQKFNMQKAKNDLIRKIKSGSERVLKQFSQQASKSYKSFLSRQLDQLKDESEEIALRQQETADQKFRDERLITNQVIQNVKEKLSTIKMVKKSFAEHQKSIADFEQLLHTKIQTSEFKLRR